MFAVAPDATLLEVVKAQSCEDVFECMVAPVPLTVKEANVRVKPVSAEPCATTTISPGPPIDTPLKVYVVKLDVL
jgi:hypothetical protein